jgi:hypothetical protein
MKALLIVPSIQCVSSVFASAARVRALYEYVAREDDELTIRPGDIIILIKENPDWWEGELNGKVGLFPYNYVEKI